MRDQRQRPRNLRFRVQSGTTDLTSTPALEKIAPADHRQWLDSRLAGQGFTRDAYGNLT